MVGKHKEVACPICGEMKRSDNLIRHLKDPRGHAKTDEQALKLRNSLKPSRAHAQEPAQEKKSRIEAMSTQMSYQIDSVTAP